MNSIRLAKASDAVAVIGIYTPYILNTAFTFETEVPSIKNFEQRIATYQESWPWIVYEADGIIAGYAYATKHRERAAYQWCVESSVYVHERFQKAGIAQSLYNTLFKILKHQGCRNVYAGITIPNEKSVSFHKKSGFTWLADYENIGYKLNRWNTVSWWQLQLNPYSDNPSPPLKFPEVEQGFLESIF
jgi:L-amino acid N-acyltransferase YncA